MAIQKGLRPDPLSRPSIGGRLKQRVQTGTPQLTPRLSPNAAPVNTAYRPAEITGGEDLLALAQGLAALNPALRAYAQEQEQGMAQKADADARFKLSGMTFDEATAAVKDGRMKEFESPWFKAAFMRQYGTRFALWRANERMDSYANSFDRENGDLEAFLSEGAELDAESFGSDEFFRAGYGEAYTRFADQLRAKHGEYQTGRIKEETVAGASARFYDVAAKGIAEGRSPAEVNNMVRSLYQGNKDLLFLTPKEQDQIILGVAEQLANEGRYDYVKELLTSDRGGIGSIVNKSALSADAYKLLRFAEGVDRDNRQKAAAGAVTGFYLDADTGNLNEAELDAFVAANPDLLSPETNASLRNRSRNERERQAAEYARIEAERGIEEELSRQDLALTQHLREVGDQGGLAFLSDAQLYTKDDLKGGSKPSKAMSPDQQREIAVTDYMEVRSAAIQEKNQETDEQRFQREVQWLTRNGVTYDKWETVMTTGYQNATASGVAGGDLGLFDQAYGLYRRLHASAPALAASLIKDRSALDFYETVRIAEQDMGLDPKQAVVTASTVLNDPTKMQEVVNRYRRDEVMSSVPNVNNAGEIGEDMERIVRVAVAMGMSPKNAIKRARERIDATHTEINGRLVYTADRNTPPNFADIAEGYLDKLAAQFGADEGFDAGDLSFRPATSASGVFVVVDAKYGIPILGQPYVSMTQLLDFEKSRVEEERAAAAAEAEQRSRDRYIPTMFSTPLGTVVIGGEKMSDEIGAPYHPKTQAAIDAFEAAQKNPKPASPETVKRVTSGATGAFSR